VTRWFRRSLSVADPFASRTSLAPPRFRFHNPLIEPNVRICRIRLLEKTHAIARTIKWIDLTGANLRRPSRNGE
jgi:hypothetical protein